MNETEGQLLALKTIVQAAQTIAAQMAPRGSVQPRVDAAPRQVKRDEPDVEASIRSVGRIGEVARRAGSTVSDITSMTSDSFTEIVDRSMNSIASEALQMSSPSFGR